MARVPLAAGAILAALTCAEGHSTGRSIDSSPPNSTRDSASTLSTGVLRGQEAAPLVVGEKYLVTPFPNILHALDLADPGTTRWSFEPQPLSAAQGVACCDLVNRGAAYKAGRVFFSTLGNHTVAVDAATGKELWRTKLGGGAGVTPGRTPGSVDGAGSSRCSACS